MKTTILSLAFLSACGAAPKTATGLGTSTDTGATVATQTAAPTTTTQDSGTETPQSFQVADESALPTCDEAREGALAEIKAEQRFVTCTAGAWNSADMTTGAVDIAKESAGANCPDGGQVIESFLDKNGNGIRDADEPLAVGAKYICNGADGANGATGTSGAVGATGASGTQGVAGATGASGTNGAAGSRGLPGSMGIFTAANVQIGTMLDEINWGVIFPDGGWFFTSAKEGSYHGALAYLDDNNVGAVCGFTTGDCTGPCYLTADPRNGGAMNYAVPNTVVWDGTTLWRYDLTDAQHTGDVSFASYWKPNGATNACTADAYTVNESYGPLTHAETLPTGVTFPFGPLHFAPLAQ